MAKTSKTAETSMRSLLWVPINLAQAVLTAAWSAFWITVACFVRLVTGGTKIPLRMAHRYWAPGLIRLGGLRTDVEGLEHLDLSTAYFFAANHQSLLDIPVMFGVLPVPLIFVVKEELLKVPFLGWYIRTMGMIHLPRRERLQSMKNLQQCRQRIQDGISILIFPEGTRSRDAVLKRFKPGVFVPAIESGAAIVPVAITGTGRCLPADSFRVRPGVARIAFGQPIATHRLKLEDRRELADQVRRRIAELLTANHPSEHAQAAANAHRASHTHRA